MEKVQIPLDVFALDLGTSKFCLAKVVEQKNGSTPQIEVVTVPAKGMYRGMLSNIPEAMDALEKLLEMAEEKFEERVRRVVVGVAGSHLAGFITEHKIQVPTESIEPNLIASIEQEIKEQNQSQDREVIHTIPVTYQMDNRPETDNPIGFSANLLKSRYFVVDADANYLRDIVKVCNSVGLEVGRFYAEPYASSSTTLSLDEKNIGVVSADIGGGTTDCIVYGNGKPVGLFTMNVGGHLMTSDLSIGLQIPLEEAEKVKISYGLSREFTTEIALGDIHGKTKIVRAKDIYPILGSRILELNKALSKKYEDEFIVSAPGGFVFTGGGSEVKDFIDFFHKTSKYQAKRARPGVPLEGLVSCNLEDEKKVVQLASRYATVSGLLYLEILKRIEEKKKNSQNWVHRYFGNFVNWIKELS